MPNPTRCSVSDCDKPPRSRGLCRPHYDHWRKHGKTEDSPKFVGHRFVTGPSNPSWRGESASYEDAHKRVRVAFGKARLHACVDCGEPAREWSYDGTDPNERQSPDGAYSFDLSRYAPRCILCHRRFDRQPKTAPAMG